MDKFKIQTSMRFPVFKLTELVTYSEVKKPSGIAYILLVLISDSKNKKDRLANVLENFGIPKSLHYMFADTIEYLLEQELLENMYFNKNAFENYQIGDFKFSEKGKKIFSEEAIPTGVNKEVKIPVFYNIALNELSFKIDQDLEPKLLMDCAITPEYMSKFTCKKNIEDFFNLNKGKKLDAHDENGKLVGSTLIKKEEIITSVEELEKENWVVKCDCDMNINNDDIVIKFDEPSLQKFFDTNYSNNMINDIIAHKKKFKLKSSFSKNLRLSSYNFDKISAVLIPKEIDEVLKLKSQLVITKGNYRYNGYEIVCENAINTFDNTIEFIQVDMHDMVYGYIPGIFTFDNELFGNIEIPLVLKIEVSNNDFKEIVKKYVIESLNDYSDKNFSELVKITDITSDFKTAELIMNFYLTDNVEQNIIRLNEIKHSAISNAGILGIYKKLLEENYNKYLEMVSEDNLETVLKISAPVTKFLNIPSKNMLESIFTKIKIKNKTKVYECLVNKGFDKSLVIMYVNPVEEVLEAQNAKDKSLLDLINFNDALIQMKELTGIIDFKKYNFDEENINRSKFKDEYNKAFNLQKNIKFLKFNNEKLFEEYDGFMKLFGEINDEINLVEDALKDPSKIKPELIEKKIVSGEYQFVFINLSAKLESILKTKYNLDDNLFEMLKEAKSSKLIKGSIISDLHEFRETRNAYVHPEKRTSNFDAADLRKWAKEIFELEEDKK